MKQESDPNDQDDQSTGPDKEIESSVFVKLWIELRRRKVMRVAAVYLAVAWIVIQIAVSTFPYLMIPEWAVSLVIMCVLLGFPVSLVLAWAFELTPDGIRRTPSAEDQAHKAKVSKKQDQKRNWLAYAVGAAFPTVIFTLIAAIFLIFFHTPDSTRNAIRSIAVLPFENLSRDPDQVYFVDGLHDGLITDLSKVSALRVISRTSTKRYEKTEMLMPEIAAELNADIIVEGSVQHADNQIVLNVQLIDAVRDDHIWSERYEKTASDVLKLQSDLARSIAVAIDANLDADEEQRLSVDRAIDPEVLEAYLKGRFYIVQRGAKNQKIGIEFFNKALEIGRASCRERV